ncbi:hypothetical protein WSS_A07324 [Rhodococcus opacus M213]|uniref:Uncharacterized protein n=1 Tax=Rhodococcus opacus M213 TaxID=1129896 RepID=K8XRK6_RHOOP|nr:hypothetical protein WSS_A07324 [Rhodococcus opacus M213]
MGGELGEHVGAEVFGARKDLQPVPVAQDRGVLPVAGGCALAAGETSDSCEESFLSYECSVPQLGGCGIAAVGGDALQRNQRFPELVCSVGEVFEIDGVGARASRESKRHAGKLNRTGRTAIVMPAGRDRACRPGENSHRRHRLDISAGGVVSALDCSLTSRNDTSPDPGFGALVVLSPRSHPGDS